jgi:hypothetical protein
MSFLNKFESVMLKIFQIMDKLNKFSNQLAEPGLSSEHNRIKTKRKYKHKRRSKNRRIKKKRQKKTITKPEILGFDYKGIGDRMMGQDKP